MEPTLKKPKQIEGYQTIKEISEIFDKVHAACFVQEETGSDKETMPFLKTFELLKRLEYSIIQQGIFSPNEQIKEINLENLKYLQLPFLIAQTAQRFQQNRKIYIQTSQKYYVEYLKLIFHYGILDVSTQKIWKNFEENDKYRPSRDEKIEQYKKDKELQLKIKNLKKIKDAEHQQEIHLMMIQQNCLASVKALQMIKEEIPLLEYKEKLEKDKDFKEKHEMEQNKPVPKLDWITIPKSEKIDQPYLISEIKKQNHHLCKTCDGQTKIEIKDQVFQQPIAFQPTNTLDQHCHENEIMMKESEEKKAIYKAKQEEEKQNMTEDQKDEQEKKKQRDWDEWKEFNSKGTGNLNGL